MDDRTRALLEAPSPILDPSLSLDPWVQLDGDKAVLESGATTATRFDSPGAGITRMRVGTAAMPADSPLLAADYRDEPLDPGGQALHRGRLQPGDPFAAGGRISGTRQGWFVTAHLTPDARVYGGGECFQGPNLRGHLRHNVNVEAHGASGLDRSYLTVPFFWTDAGWGLFFHTGAPMIADLGATHGEVAAFAVEGDGLDVFVIEGTPEEILRRYLAVTGRPGRFPEWAFGIWTSRCSYLNEIEVHDVVDGYEQAGIPADVVHVDAWVTGNVIKDLTCSWDVDRNRWPEGWGDRLAERGVRTSLWHNPYVLPGTAAGDELAASGLLLADEEGKPVGTNDMPERLVIDFTDEEAVAWWKERVTRTAESEGNASFKPDFAEEVPPAALCHDGRTGWEIRNEYAVRYQRATHEALVELRRARGEDDAIALFCRSGTAGAQRYPCHWVGDTPSTWTGLVTALRACLSLSLSGFALVSHDIGGFWTPAAFAHTEAAFDHLDPSLFVADVDPELYTRWTQWGALSPVMRFHGTGRREPFAYPEPYRAVATEACRLRHRLRDYLGRTATEAHEVGTPVMRPMVLAVPDDRAARAADLQYFLGPDILVAPVIEPGAATRAVYVPAGRWQPLAGLDAVTGPAWIDVDVPLDAFPAWVREGVAL